MSATGTGQTAAAAVFPNLTTQSQSLNSLASSTFPTFSPSSFPFSLFPISFAPSSDRSSGIIVTSNKKLDITVTSDDNYRTNNETDSAL